MLYQLMNGLTVDISVDLYLRMSDVDLNELFMGGGGFYASSIRICDGDLFKIDVDIVEDRDNMLLEKYLDVNGDIPSYIVLEGEDEEDDYIDDYYDYDD